jgi:asparagine synthase (glutamine-hydrolysing)
MGFRGPDGEHLWTARGAGFGHTLLRTTDGEAHPQPATLDGQTWITADARIDAKDELIARLEESGCSHTGEADDALLILQAYHAWGDDCVKRLLGDFAFAIRDGRTNRLVCARDQFGIKPFYFAEIAQAFVFSNTLDSLRAHPHVSDRLNELALADFLLFGVNQDPQTTVFADIKRLPPAHILTIDEHGLQVRRYWSVPTDGYIRYKRSREYVERFLELLHKAVDDRVRSARTAVWMSGGLDSTSITAAARKVLSDRGTEFDLRAHTVVYDTLIPDEEGHYARLAASALGVENSVLVADSYEPLAALSAAAASVPEPTDDPSLVLRVRQLEEISLRSRTLLCGEGGDELLWPTRAMDVVRHVPLWELAADFSRSVLAHRRRPAIGLRSSVRRVFASEGGSVRYPQWINPALTARLRLRERWEHAHRDEPRGSHPCRPEAHRRLSTVPWSSYFECSDPGFTRVPVEVRYPFLDLRLVDYLLAIPPMPWCVDKHILRLAMRETLPNPVRLRPKAPLGGDPLAIKLSECGSSWSHDIDRAAVAPYVNVDAIPISPTGYHGSDPWLDIRPLCLASWLRSAPGNRT